MAAKNQNFISVDGRTVRNSYGQFFTIGEIVSHQDEEAGKATIMSFQTNFEKNEIEVITSKGMAHLDFIQKLD